MNINRRKERGKEEMEEGEGEEDINGRREVRGGGGRGGGFNTRETERKREKKGNRI